MRTQTMALLGLAVALAGCGASSGDVEELKKGQKEILAKLEALDKSVAQVKAGPVATRPPIDPNKVYPLAVGESPVKGAKDARVTIVEFSDYQCPYCSRAEPLVEQIVDAYPKDVQRVYKQFPLPMHPNAMPASKAALAAHKQGKFWEMHRKLFDNQTALGPDNYKKWAQEIGLDVARFEKDMSAPEVQAQIDKEMQEARGAEVTGTPTIFVNGKRLQPQQRNLEGFKAVIDAALQAKS